MSSSIQTIPRQPWRRKQLPRHTIQALVRTMVVATALSALIATVAFGYANTELLSIEFEQVSILAIILLSVLSCIYIYISWFNVEYILEPSMIKTTSDFVNTKPGRVIIRQGVLRKRTTIHTTAEFNSLAIHKPILGRISNYGHVRLFKQSDNNPQSQRLVCELTNIKHPDKVGLLIQEMIDNAYGDQVPMPPQQ